ncbi:MAG: methylmalonyl-CoA epimerase [Bacteroidota bacterium]|nr:methylmalonyl-CoA epimerase [Bacteroidota bacterium]MEC9208896.1 methylmalonyl-CoA epimerase [Bacteroidota bacterium]
MKKIEHIGIAVQDIEASNKIFAKIFGKDSYKLEKVESEGVITSFFEIGENKIELVASTTEESVISKYLEKWGEGLHHIAFSVEDIEKEMTRLKKEGIRLLNEIPKNGADNQLICFLHPKDTNGVLIELCQEIK